jgi:ligand-binding sensor domain-containing protein/signal transduction histidine kinase/AraC-like DNA-binding protein
MYRCIHRLALFSIFSACVFSVAGAQHLKFESFTVEDGLSQNTVLSIVRDRQGFMWFGTRDGLNRFDTHSYKVYRNNLHDTHSIPGNEVGALLVDNNGTLWVGTDGGICRYDQRNDNFIRVVCHEGIEKEPEDAEVLAIYMDSRDRIWVGTVAGLYLIRNDSDGQYRLVRPRMEQDIQDPVFAIHEDQLGGVWIGAGHQLCRMEITGVDVLSAAMIDPHIFSDLEPGSPISGIVEYPVGVVWIGYRDGGVLKYSTGTGRTKRYTANGTDGLSDGRVLDLSCDAQGRLWIGTENGLNILDPATDRVQVIFAEHDGAWGLRDNTVHALYRDQNQNMWIGTQYGGAHLHSERFMLFEAHYLSNDPSGMPVRPIATCIAGDRAGKLFFGVANHGIVQFDTRTRKFKDFGISGVHFNAQSAGQIQYMFTDRVGTIWYSTTRGNLHTYNFNGGIVDRHPDLMYVRSALHGEVVVSMVEDLNSNMWFGTAGGGLRLYNTNTKEVLRIEAESTDYRLPSNKIQTMLVGNDGRVWVGTKSGLYLFDPKTGRDSVFKVDLSDTSALASDNIRCLFQDHAGNLWVGTKHGGLHKYNGPSGTFTRFDEGDGLAGNAVAGILEDQQHRLWISTNNGLSFFDYSTERIINYNTRDGLPGMEFNKNACYLAANGEMFFASTQGLVSFFPGRLVVNDRPPPLVFTGLRLLGEMVSAGGPAGILEKNITETTNIHLGYRDNSFSIVFAALNYINSAKNRYAYRVLGGEERWMHTSIPEVTFNDLDPGRYVLEVKGSNNDMVWNPEPAVMHINVTHAPWKSPWAYLLYLTVAAGIAVTVFRIVTSRSRFRRHLHAERERQTKMEKVHQAKINFFTHIAHELITPLTSIAHPVEELLRVYRDDQALIGKLSRVQVQVEHLIRLVNQLLDFRRLERAEYKIHARETDLVHFVQEFELVFQAIAEHKKVDFSLEVDASSLIAWIDRAEFEKVIDSLVYKAFQNIREGGQITFRLGRLKEGPHGMGPSVLIEVEDNGPGIPRDHLHQIFDLKYEADDGDHWDPGYDVGLAVAKGIVQAHGGRIQLESIPQSSDREGRTVFSVYIPQGSDHLSAESLAPSILESASSGAFELMDDLLSQRRIEDAEEALITKKHSILLVGGDRELLHYMETSLQEDYNVFVAGDGNAALEIARNKLPDLVISDILIPGMDGLALCRNIKGNTLTAHMPVILLTIRTGWIFRSQGVKTGADYYITKPFSVDALKLHIHSALKHSLRQSKNHKKAYTPSSNIRVTVQEEAFLKQVVKIIEDYMADPGFGVEKLAHEIGMSRPVLYRRLKAITGRSIIDFITDIRLKRAMLLLENGGWRISDVAFEVGISDRKHFTKLFKKSYGKTPTEFLASKKGSGDLAIEDA